MNKKKMMITMIKVIRMIKMINHYRMIKYSKKKIVNNSPINSHKLIHNKPSILIKVSKHKVKI
jgi:hypothetical protein